MSVGSITTAVVSNSELILHKGENGQTLEVMNYLTGNKAWGSGNSVPAGALIVGDYAGSYNYTASCTLINTQVSVQKIEGDPADPQIIKTVRGLGYKVDA